MKFDPYRTAILMTSNRIPPQFVEWIDQLVGATCCRVDCGVIGSVFYMDFRKNETEDISLEVINTVWRVESPDKVLATSDDDNSTGGPIVQALSGLQSRVVTTASVGFPSLDLQIKFDNLINLYLFNLSKTLLGTSRGYTLSKSEITFAARQGYDITVEENGQLGKYKGK